MALERLSNCHWLICYLIQIAVRNWSSVFCWSPWVVVGLLRNYPDVLDLMVRFADELQSLELISTGEYKASGGFMYDLLEKIGLRFDTFTHIYDIINASIAYLKGPSMQNNTGNKCCKIRSAVQ